MDKKKLEKYKKRYFKHSGPPESESYLHDSKFDKEEGQVCVSTDNSLVYRLLKRLAPESVINIKDCGVGMVELTIKRKAFRGIEYAFKVEK